MNGGYAMIDGTGVNLLSESSQTVTGLYAQCDTAFKSGKPVWAYGMLYGAGHALSPVPLFLNLEDGVYIGTCSILQVRITSQDAVTIVSLLN